MCEVSRKIAFLEGKELNGYTIKIDKMSMGRFVEEMNFELYFKNPLGEISESPVVEGKYFSGRGKYYKPWIEVYYNPSIEFKSSKMLDLSLERLDEKLFAFLSDLIPPGGHFMVVYLGHEATEKGLKGGVPAPVTPIGYLLWKSGCTWFKDWYFAEGFWEGDVKLQGNKPVDEKQRRKDLLAVRDELVRFLSVESKDLLILEAKRRAVEIVREIEKETRR